MSVIRSVCVSEIVSVNVSLSMSVGLNVRVLV